MAIEIWTEKYRPEKLDEIVGQLHIIDRLGAFVKQKTLPHMLFAGPAGCGKTTAAIALAKELYGKEWQTNFMETNASDERGIDVVRGRIKDFARARSIGTVPFKMIFLDESDALTPEAQNALRRTMERYSATTRFILSCNYSSKIIPPIQSRCAVLRFKPLDDKDVTARLEHIASKEALKITKEGMAALLQNAEGDMRRAINLLQSVAIVSKKVDEDAVYKVAASLRPAEAREILELALKKRFVDARKKLMDLMIDRGLSGLDVIKAFHREILDLPVAERSKAALIDRLGEYEFRIVEGGTEDIQIEAFLAQLAALEK